MLDLERELTDGSRGPLAHAHFMRTFCQRISPPQIHVPEKEAKPLIPLSEEPSDSSTIASLPTVSAAEATPKKPAEQVEVGTPKSDAKKKNKSEQLAERHPKRAKRANGPPGNPAGTKTARALGRLPSQASLEGPRPSLSTGKLILFVRTLPVFLLPESNVSW